MNTEELRRVAEAATPGPWFVCREVNDDGTVDIETGRHSDWPPAQNCEFPTCHYIAAFNPKTAIELLDRLAALEAENAALKADAERFVWYVSETPKPSDFMADYFKGLREGWSIDQWRIAIDYARSKT
jgi:hypothetical protein